MSEATRASRADVLRVVRSVRRRWRFGVALRGLAIVLGATGLVVFISALGLERFRFSPESVLWLRFLTWSTLVATVLLFVVRPLLRRVSDEQVALYLEEHEPSLNHAVVSALEADRVAAVSPALSRGLVTMALQRAREVHFGKRVEQSRLYRGSGALALLTVAALAAVTLGPEHLRIGLSALLVPTTDAAAVNPYAVSVQPGDVTIARGSDQMVTAQLSGFDAENASVFTRSGPDGSFQRLSMLPPRTAASRCCSWGSRTARSTSWNPRGSGRGPSLSTWRIFRMSTAWISPTTSRATRGCRRAP